MAHINNIRDADVHFTIDPITRAIKNAASTKTSVIQYDHNSERFTFMLPRYIEGHDMMESTKVEVHYINANAAASGVYVVEDLQTDETEENVVCSWLLSQNVTQNAGVIHFLLRFACIAEDGTVEYIWNTAIYKGISVASGMNNADAIIEQNADVLEYWKRELTSVVEDIKNDIAVREKWDLLVDETLTEDLATEFRHVFDKSYKRLRFKIIFKGQTALNSVRFKKSKTDGGNSPTANNYIKYSSGNTSTARYLSATVSYDLDGKIILTNGAETNGTSGFGDKGGATYGGDVSYGEKYRTFPEFFFYLGGSIADDGTLSGNVLGKGTTIQVWGCEK